VRAHLIQFPTYVDVRGTLTVAQHEVPFEVSRAFWIYDVPCGEKRGQHSLKTCHQVLVALRGRLDVIVDGVRYHLCSPQYGLHVEPMAWRVMENFSSDAICLVLASELYDAEDYVWDYGEYKRLAVMV